MTLRDLFNSPTEFVLDGETFRVRQPNQLEQGQYQAWLEQLAFDAINRRTYQSDAEKLACLRMHDQDCAAGVYEWGGEVATRRVQTPKGLAKLLAVICRDEGLTDKKAEKLVEAETAKLAAVLVSRITQDPKALEAALATLGLPSDFFSSNSATPPSATPDASKPSGDSPTTS